MLGAGLLMFGTKACPLSAISVGRVMLLRIALSVASVGCVVNLGILVVTVGMCHLLGIRRSLVLIHKCLWILPRLRRLHLLLVLLVWRLFLFLPSCILPMLFLSTQMDVNCPVDVVSAPTDAAAPSTGSPEAASFSSSESVSVDLRDNELFPDLFSHDDLPVGEGTTILSGSNSLTGCVSFTVNEFGSEASPSVLNSACNSIIDVPSAVSSGVTYSCSVSSAKKSGGINTKVCNAVTDNSNLSSRRINASDKLNDNPTESSEGGGGLNLVLLIPLKIAVVLFLKMIIT